MLLQTRHLSLAYPSKLLCAALNLSVSAGECWAILGQNGSGKTTLLHALGGLLSLRPLSAKREGSPIALSPAGGRELERGCVPVTNTGNVQFEGKLLSAWPRQQLAQKLGVMLQEEPGEFWGSVEEYVLLGRHPHARASQNIFGWQAQDLDLAAAAIAQMELTALAQRQLSTLSGGERQRARISLLLAQAPQCYLLDEPLQHLDLRHQRAAMQLFKQLAAQGAAVVMVLHDPAVARRYCDHALLLFEGGKALSGTAAEMLTREHLEALYQCPLEG